MAGRPPRLSGYNRAAPAPDALHSARTLLTTVNLRDTTRDIVGQVESLTGYPVEGAEDRALPAPAGVHVAGRRALPANLIRYSPSGRRLPRFAPQVYAPILEFDEFGDVAELARQGRTRVAQAEMRAGAVGGECALPGRRGLDLNKAEPKYELRTLPGEYSALSVVSIMVAAFQQFAPGTDVGIDLAQEYAAAVQIRGRQP